MIPRISGHDAEEYLRHHGWEFIDHDGRTERTGWWVLPSATDVRGMRRGDPKPYLQSAVTTVELYTTGVE